MRDSFIFYRSFYESGKALSDKDRLSLYDAIFELALNQAETKHEPMVNAFMNLIKPQVMANNKRFENGKKGGRPIAKKHNNNLDITKPKPNVNANANVNVNANANVKKKRTVFKKPSITQIQEYITSKNYQVNAERFYHFYESKNWFVGKNKMKSWQSAVVNWQIKEKTKPQQYQTKQEKTDEAIEKFVDEKYESLANQGTQIDYSEEPF